MFGLRKHFRQEYGSFLIILGLMNAKRWVDCIAEALNNCMLPCKQSTHKAIWKLNAFTIEQGKEKWDFKRRMRCQKIDLTKSLNLTSSEQL